MAPPSGVHLKGMGMTRTGDDATAQKGVLKQEGPRSPGPAPAPRASSTLPPRALLQRLVPQHRRGAGALHEQEGQPFRKSVTQLKRGLGAASWQSLGTSFLTRAKGNPKGTVWRQRRSPASAVCNLGFASCCEFLMPARPSRITSNSHTTGLQATGSHSHSR